MEYKQALIYLIRRDLRISDNPILHFLSTQKDNPFTYVLPLYIFNAQKLEVSGFIPEGDGAKSPYKEARSQVGGFPRCGPHRSKFLAESVWDLKEELEKLGSGLCIRVGSTSDVIRELIPQLSGTGRSLKVRALWMVGEEGVEESSEERAVRDACTEGDVDFKLWNDEKYLIDDRDLPFNNIDELSDVFTTYRKTVEPLREYPRTALPAPEKDSLPGLPPTVAPQHKPFVIPEGFQGLLDALLKPLKALAFIPEFPYPPDTKSAHPFLGGETSALERLDHLISSGSVSNFHSTRNGLLGEDFSTKLSAYLALGSITARQIHASLVSFEDGTNTKYESAVGFGEGENDGTKTIRLELLWRDYMRLCTRKFGPKLFDITGFKSSDCETSWFSPTNAGPSHTDAEVKIMISRFINGTTGMGLIDASLRELIHTGYTSNRARQNVASFLAKHLHIDWRIGAEWYECMLVDHDLSSNWGNWQYLAGVGNDPRGEARIFNPVKQAFDYDPKGEYVKAWVPEIRGLTEPSEIFQAWTASDARKEELGLKGKNWVDNPLLKIEFTVGRRGRYPGRGGKHGGGDDRGGRGGGKGSNWMNGGERGIGRSRGQPRGRYGGRGYGNSRGHLSGHGRGRGESGRKGRVWG